MCGRVGVLCMRREDYGESECECVDVWVCVCVHLWTTRVSVWVGVHVVVAQTWAASLRLAGMSNNRKQTEAVWQDP